MTSGFSPLKAAFAVATISFFLLPACHEAVGGATGDEGEGSSEVRLPDIAGGMGTSATDGGGARGGSNGPDAEGAPAVGTAPPVPPGYKLDVLFVVGKTKSMADTQRRLAAAAPAFVAELKRRQVNDLRVGVLSGFVGLDGGDSPGDPLCHRSFGDKNTLQGGKACLSGNSFLQLSGSSASAPDVGEELGCMLQVGTAGCVFSMPLKAFLSFRVTDAAKAEGGFLRYDAELLVVVVSDEDDCSMGGTQGVQFFQYRTGQSRRLRCATAGHICNKTVLEAREQSIPFSQCESFWTGGDMLILVQDDVVPVLEEVRDRKRARRAFWKSGAPEPRVMFAALSGWPSEANLGDARYEYKNSTSAVSGESLLDIAPICGESDGVARPGFRLRDLAGRLGPDGLYLSVCGNDLRPALIQVAGLP